jgi:hypothetical protein
MLRTAPMTWPVVTGAAAILLGGLSFLPGWIGHYREMRGEGYRTLSLDLSAWQGGAVPILAAGVIVTVAIGLVVAGWSGMRRDGPVPWALSLGAGVGLGLIAAAAWPIAHVGQVSGLWLSPGWAVFAGIVLAAVVVAGSLKLARARPSVAGATLGLAGAALVAAVGGRTAILDAAEADRPHWSDGSYSRQVAGGEPMVLRLEDGTYRLDDAWSGRFESSGLTMILVDDPACPEARGAYRIFSAGDGDIRWELIVDVCDDEGRRPDFVGVWQRDD